ncbi:vanin-like protein 1 [Achroia grisella]|uniref:vanin-like protein 1 n=1 Tax=Achroia grisella TaxID=688607 RepID=UPI0027D21FFA|nr:vanin-like protein 1 [Achroia grisella]
MRLLINTVICFLWCTMSLASDTYRAGVVNSVHSDLTEYVPFIQQAAESDVDILVLPSAEELFFETSTFGSDIYDDVVKTLSDATKQAGLYVVAHLYETVRCQDSNETVRSNLVFGRDGSVISVYRKPVNNVSNCTTGSTDFGVFTTDFDVTFGSLMEEDLVLKSPGELKGLKNFVVTGSWTTQIPFLSASKFSSSWAFVNKVNLVSIDGISDGSATNGDVKFADLEKHGLQDVKFRAPVIHTAELQGFLGEDASQYVIKPLNLEASSRGYKDAVCHGSFCCEFYVKTSFAGYKAVNANYSLVAFSGYRHFGSGHNIGLESCAVIASAGQDKCTCPVGNENSASYLRFDKVTVVGNFTNGNSNYPIVLTTRAPQAKHLSFDSISIDNTEQVVMELKNVANVLSLGISSRDFSKDIINSLSIEPKYKDELDIYDYIFNEDVQEFFDYVWIRLRILIFVVSIYILEMM